MKPKKNFRVSSIPNHRVGTIDIGVASRSKHHISALVEFDVTEARRLLKHKDNESISFTAWLIKCISLAVEENKQIQAIRYGRKKIIIFDDVDVTVMVEKEVNGVKMPFPCVIRKTHEKTLVEISNEIHDAQQQTVDNEGDMVLGDKKDARMMKLYANLPAWIRNVIWRYILKHPFLIKDQMGTIMVTSVGIAGRFHGWVIPKSVHPVSFAIGSIVKKPAVHQNEISIRDTIYITVTVDHDVIDGVPAMRVLAKLTKLLESGYGLTNSNPS